MCQNLGVPEFLHSKKHRKNPGAKAVLSCGYWSKPYDDGLWPGKQVPVPSSEPRVPRTDQTALIVFINQIPLVKY
jgi:hypothetical protein